MINLARLESASSTPLWRLWGAFFAYTAVVALMVQWVLLPYVFPAWHAGNGLLVGGDWLSFHRMAVDLAEKIHAQGWSAWELRPDGINAPAGIAGAMYALVAPQPWAVIPINAVLHATAGLVLLRIVLFFIPNWRLAVWSILPFLLYPSAMTWYTQLHKDGYSIAGVILFVYGLVLLARLETWRRGWWPPLQATLWIIMGTLLVWIVRPYVVQMMQGVGVFLSLLLTGVFLARGARSGLEWRKAIAGSLLIWAIVIGMTPLTRGGIPAPVAPPVASWQTSSWLPSFLENRFYTLAVLREKYRISYPNAASNLDAHVRFRKASEVISYLPRAAQISFLAPFPNQWFEQGSGGPSKMMRRTSTLEMIGVYFALAFLPYAIWRWRRRVETWLVLAFCSGMMLIYPLVINNVGALYRLRYGYVMTLVALGIVGFIAAVEKIRLRRPPRRVLLPG